MASKGKIKHRRECKRTDMKRFAYDVIVYTAKKFELQESCIAKWNGPENVYEYDDFCLVVARLVLRYQIALRKIAYQIFEYYYKKHGFESVKKVEEVLPNVMNAVMHVHFNLITNGLDIVEISLSIASEFILFLYSENFKTLYLKQVAGFWFKYIYCVWKNEFKTNGFLRPLYTKGKEIGCDHIDRFYDEFIEKHCFPYEDSEKREQLWDQFRNEAMKKGGRIKEMLPPINFNDSPPPINFNDSPNESNFRNMMMCNIPRPSPLISKQDSGIDLPQNTGLGIQPHEELLRDIIANDDTLSQSLTVERPKHPRRSSGGQKRRNITSNLGSKVAQGIGDSRLDSSRNRQEPAEEYKGSSSQDTRQGISNSPQSSIAYEATPSQNPTGARPKDSQIHGRGSSDRQRPKSKPSSFSSLEEGIGDLRLDSSGRKD